MATTTQMDRAFRIMRKAGVVWSDPTIVSSLRTAGSDLTYMEFLGTIRETQEYKTRFPAFAEMKVRDNTIQTEADYIQQEEKYKLSIGKYVTDVTVASGLTSVSKLAEFMLNDVSQVEVEDRLQAADRLIKQSPDEYKTALNQYYGIDNGDILAFLVDPVTTKPLLDVKAEERLRGVTLGTKALQSGLNITREQLQDLNTRVANKYQDWSTSAMTTNIEETMKAAQLEAMDQSALAGIEGQQYSSYEAIQSQTGDVEAGLASRKRAERERARFGGTSAVQRGSLSIDRGL
jgi:hypothetical protein